jgi:hypothetical protein
MRKALAALGEGDTLVADVFVRREALQGLQGALMKSAR